MQFHHRFSLEFTNTEKDNTAANRVPTPNMDFRVRNAFGHVPVTLCTKRRKFMDFDQKIIRIHGKCRKMNEFESIAPPGSVQNDVQKLLKNAKSSKIRENLRSVAFENALKFAF